MERAELSRQFGCLVWRILQLQKFIAIPINNWQKKERRIMPPIFCPNKNAAGEDESRSQLITGYTAFKKPTLGKNAEILNCFLPGDTC